MGSMFFKNGPSRVKLYYINKALFFSLVILVVILILVFPFRKVCTKLALNLAGGYIGNPVVVLSKGLPSSLLPSTEETYYFEGDWNFWGEQVVRVMTGVNISAPFSLLNTELTLAEAQVVADLLTLSSPLVEEEGGEEDFYLPNQDQDLEEWLTIPEDEYPPVQLDGEPMVLVYTTHNGEAYLPTQGVSRQDGKNSGITSVAEVLFQTLQNKHRLKTVYSDNAHDFPDFTKAYYISRQTVKKQLQQHAMIQVVLDIHRDAGLKKRTDTLVRINGKDCAKVMIVVGTAHPQWQQNLAFAQKIEKKANELYPGLIKCVRLFKDRTYNQNLHTRALLLEFGSDLNKEEDALESAKLMADVVATVLKD